MNVWHSTIQFVYPYTVQLYSYIENNLNENVLMFRRTKIIQEYICW